MATPKILLYEVELRAVRLKRNLSRPVVYTNDLNSAEFQFKVIDMDAGDLSTATATTLLYMRDGSFFQNPKEDVSLVGTTFSYTLKENEGNHAGIAQIQLVVTIDDAEFASQLFEFEIINGLETKVAQEVMIYDWTTLTRDARAYIDQFVADELLRDAEFDNNEFDRNTAFVASQDARSLAFGTEQTNRGTAFTDEQNERTTAFNESESGRTTAETGRVTAESNRVTAESGRATKEGQRVTAESGRVTAEGGRITAESGRVTAESGRVTTFAGYNARITGMEADVNANGTNVITNGDMTSASGWYGNLATLVASNNELSVTITSKAASTGAITPNTTIPNGNKFYVAAEINAKYSGNILIGYDQNRVTIPNPTPGVYTRFSASGTKASNDNIVIYHDTTSASYVVGDVFKIRKAFAIDLTAAFGKGNEPTAEQMDALLAKFTNSWFDGTKNLFRANATLNKLMALDARTEFEAKNLAINGDLSNGETGITILNMGSYTISANEFVGVANGVGGGVRSTGLSITANHKYYAVSNVKASSALVKMRLYDGVTLYSKSHSGSGSYERLSFIFTPTNSTGSSGQFQRVLDDRASAWDEIRLKYSLLINLTEAFGAGKEPTLAEMDRLMTRFPNSWFDGVKPIQTIETLYQEKANKVQEAWIAPTILNGVTTDSSYPVKYFKDEFGIVRIRGQLYSTADTIMFTLPVGYRPSQRMMFPVVAGTLVFGIVAVDIDGTVKARTNLSVYGILDSISFKV
nr:hypothetical protein [uncultured Trichococcus sp.]